MEKEKKPKKLGRSAAAALLMTLSVVTILTSNIRLRLIDVAAGKPLSETPPSRLELNTETLHGHSVHFRSYGDENYAAAKRRIVKEAEATGWFATAKALGPENLSDSFRARFSDVLALPRGRGYWIWKYFVIEDAMESMEEGDFLVYLDAGCQVNKGGEERFVQYLRMVEQSEYDMVGFQLGPFLREHQFAGQRVLDAFNISLDTHTDITYSAQYEGGTLIIRKGPHYRKWMDMCLGVLDGDPWLITDKYDEESKRLNPQFQTSRHDQTISSISRKLLGCIQINAMETKHAQPDKPFHVMRRRD